MHMQLLMDRTNNTADLDGVPCRLWEGTGPDGCRFAAWVHRVVPMDDRARAHAETCLDAVDAPALLGPGTVEMPAEGLVALVARWVMDREGSTCESRSQAAMTRLVKTCLEDGEPVMAASLILLVYARSSGVDGAALTALSLGLGRYGVDFDGPAERAPYDPMEDLARGRPS